MAVDAGRRGTYNIRTICTSDGTHWSSEGIRHPQSVEILAVSRTIPDAMRDPTNQEALNMDVMNGRSFGYDSSPSIDEPETRQKTIPNPRIIRATIYIPTCEGLAHALMSRVK